jgi:hypothetical protein
MTRGPGITRAGDRIAQLPFLQGAHARHGGEAACSVVKALPAIAYADCAGVSPSPRQWAGLRVHVAVDVDVPVDEAGRIVSP